MLELVKYLEQHQGELLGAPVNGDLVLVGELYGADVRGTIGEINKLAKCIETDGDRLVSVDLAGLRCLAGVLNPQQVRQAYPAPQVAQQAQQVARQAQQVARQVAQQAQQVARQAQQSQQPAQQPLEHLHRLLRYSPRRTSLDKLTSLLQYETAHTRLARRAAQLSTPQQPFVPVCEDPQHAKWLAASRCNAELAACLDTKIHFVPILRKHTDVSMGDCSYLDTCHKMDTCRYVHYAKKVPQHEISRQVEQQRGRFTPDLKLLSDSCYDRAKIPSQWVNCDVTKLDMDVLGKFGVVLADPSWNIHMNNNSTNSAKSESFNDNEFMNLNLGTLQDEGVFFLWVTGRSIEIGKISLEKWGYRLVNEMIWIKLNQLLRTICTGRTGHWLNHCKEHVLVGVKGDPQWLNRLVDLDYMVSVTRETSRKPDELYEIIDRLAGPNTRKLEIFGKQHNLRDGWVTIGNQLNGVSLHELQVKNKFLF